jgi:hypothetical protein
MGTASMLTPDMICREFYRLVAPRMFESADSFHGEIEIPGATLYWGLNEFSSRILEAAAYAAKPGRVYVPSGSRIDKLGDIYLSSTWKWSGFGFGSDDRVA